MKCWREQELALYNARIWEQYWREKPYAAQAGYKITIVFRYVCIC